MNINSINSQNSFDALAIKLRMQKFDKKQILQYKNEAIISQKIKNKRKKAILTLQRIFRGFSLRKKFRNIIEDLNRNIIIEYFKDKRRQKIKENYKNIINRNLDKYLDRRREIKRNILIEFYEYCVNLIIKTFKGYRIRKFYSPLIMNIKCSKEKISALLNSFKIRIILRTNKIQEILVEIANIQNCLETLNHDERNSNKTEKLRSEFMKRLAKLLINFNEEFYKIKRSRFWTNCSRTEKPWMDKFISIMTMGTIKNIFTENTHILTDENQESKVNSNFNRTEDLNSSIKIIKENDRIYLPVANKLNISYNSNISPRSNTENMNINSNQNYLDYDNKPIKVNTKKTYDFSQFEEVTKEEDIPEQEVKIKQKSKKKKEALKRKAPKYDARKAIEESNKDSPQENEKNKERGAFRKFLKEMREMDKDVNENEVGTNSSNLNSNRKNDEENKSKIKKENNQSKSNKDIKEPKEMKDTSNNLGGSAKVEENTVPRRSKVITTEISLRKKLHELEKSPPPRVKYFHY